MILFHDVQEMRGKVVRTCHQGI